VYKHVAKLIYTHTEREKEERKKKKEREREKEELNRIKYINYYHGT